MITIRSSALAALTALALAACGSGGGSSGTTGGSGGGAPSGDCGAKPLDCPATETCWVKDSMGSALVCLTAGDGKLGDPCTSFPAKPSCGHGLTCLQLEGGKPGVCTPFCDPKDPAVACAGMAPCITVSYAPGNATTHACKPPEAGTGGGGAGGGA
ncbi:MAG: hypothetical protein U0359_23745 [Byssovorax sp.]